MRTLIEEIEQACRDHPDLTAIRHRTDSIRYRELGDAITNVAKNAIAAGAVPGDRFLYAARPTPRSLAVTLGMLRAGMTLVFVDPFTAPALYATRAGLVEPAFTLADSFLYLAGHRNLRWARALRNVNICDFGAVEARHMFIGARLPGVPRNAIRADDWMRTAPSVELPAVDPARDAVITFTSGTTSDPKGVVHSQRTLASNVELFADELGIHPRTVVYSEPMTVGVVALSRGAEWRIPDASDKDVLADVYFGVPSDLLDMLDRPKHRFRAHVVATGAAPVLPSLVERVDGQMGERTRIISVYGATEMLPMATCDARRKRDHLEGDLVGAPIGDTRVKLAPDGEILVAGPGLMERYFGQPPEEWHSTGDLGRVVDGELVLLGRKKNMLIRGNKNIYPSLYEPAISTIDGVQDAAIVGVPDEYGDDRVILFISREMDHPAEAVQRRVQAALPEHFDGDAIPDHVWVLDHLPVSGRARKRDMDELRTIAAERLADLR
jgi:acyl-CoA synthetase (AMP-forming)/AMP-acid ligase II